MLVRRSPISPPSSSSELTSASGERGKKVCGTALRFVFEAIAAAAAAALRGRTDTATHLHARLPHYSVEFRRQAMLCPHRERRPRPRTCLSLPEVPPPPQPLLHSRRRLLRLRLPACLVALFLSGCGGGRGLSPICFGRRNRRRHQPTERPRYFFSPPPRVAAVPRGARRDRLLGRSSSARRGESI